MDEDTLTEAAPSDNSAPAEAATKTESSETTDIFLWANNADQYKNALTVEFFAFNKNYTPYSMSFSGELEVQVRALFLFDVINFINLGAGTGLSVRDFELSESEENVLLRADLEKVGRAETLIHTIEHSRGEIVAFSEKEHEFKRVKGIVARFTQDGKTPFYVVKQIRNSGTLSGATAWELHGDTFKEFSAEVGLKVPAENHVLIVDKDIFIFNQSKFEALFNYDYKTQLITENKAKEIEQHFKLSFADGADLQTMLMERKKLIKKVQELDPAIVTQDELMKQAEELNLELMVSDNDEIIIMDGNDLDTFVNLLNDDYMTSDMTGRRYIVKSKKPLEESEGEAPRPMAG